MAKHSRTKRRSTTAPSPTAEQLIEPIVLSLQHAVEPGMASGKSHDLPPIAPADPPPL
jgi:hypothetical protein